MMEGAASGNHRDGGHSRSHRKEEEIEGRKEGRKAARETDSCMK